MGQVNNRSHCLRFLLSLVVVVTVPLVAGEGAAQAPCEQPELRAEARAAIGEAAPLEQRLLAAGIASLPDEKSSEAKIRPFEAELKLVMQKLRQAGSIRTDRGHPICDLDGKDLKRRARSQQKSLDKYAAEIRQKLRAIGIVESEVTAELAYSYSGAAGLGDVVAVRLDGQQVSKDRFVLGPGEHSIAIEHSPSSATRTVTVTLEVDKTKKRPIGFTETEKHFNFHTEAGASIKLAIVVDVQEIPEPMFARTAVNPEDADVVIKLNDVRIEAGAAAELTPGEQNTLVISHPSTTDKRWYHVTATLDEDKFVPTRAETDRKVFEFDGKVGQTRVVGIDYRTGSFEQSLRPTLIWGGLGLGVVGAVVGIWGSVTSSSHVTEGEELFFENRCQLGAASCDQEVRDEVGSLYSEADTRTTIGAVGYVAGGVGFVTMFVGLLALDAGEEPPDGLVSGSGSGTSASFASLRVVPALGPSLYSASIAGSW